MSFSYADAIKRQQREGRPPESINSRKKDVINSLSNDDGKLVLHREYESKTNPNKGSSFHDGSKHVAKSINTWRDIAGKKNLSGSPTSKQSSVQRSDGRRGKRKGINGNSSGNEQKSSKPKPSLRSVSIGNVLAPIAKQNARTSSVASDAILSKSTQLQPKSHVEFPALSASIRKLPTPTLKWGAPPRRAPSKGTKRGDQATLRTKPKKAPSKKDSTKRNSTSDPTTSVAAMFAKPRDYHDRARDGEEHELLRLMQERTVYKKKGRQRVAPRKKKLTALKKKVLQERLKKWQELHPNQTVFVGKVKGNLSTNSALSECSESICLYNFAHGDDLEDDDELEEVEHNLREMAAKVAEVDRILVPRGLDRSSKYPVFVRFKTMEGAVTAKACWEGLVIAGDVLSVVFIDESNFNRNSDWSDEIIAAEGKGSFSPMHAASKADNKTTKIAILGVLSEDDYDDSDCMEESLSFLEQAAAKYANVTTVHPSGERDGNVVLVCSGDSTTAQAVVRGLSSTVIAGESLSAFVLETNGQTSESMPLSYIVLENLLTQDDFEDKECLQETLSDVKELIEKHGKVVGIGAEGDKVQVCFMGNDSAAHDAVFEMNGLVLGGGAVFACIERLDERLVFLSNMLSEDDMDDDDCLEESLNDIRSSISKYGEVAGLNIIRDQNIVGVKFVPDTLRSSIDTVVAELNGSVIGGRIISASSSFRRNPNDEETLVASKPLLPATGTDLEAKEPLYSGDKIIPEFFAKCKRVPKIPNGVGLRNYAQVTNDEQVRPLLTEMLGELMRLQKRAIEDKNAKARRRLVMGLREVCRGIRAHKVKMVVMANNLDEYGDEKLQQIIDLARAETIPLFFEFTKRSLGKALGKTIKVAVVGIQNADGAHQQFKKLIAIQQR
ncbi:unnamed protein product [Cylindrotheca closterium]|uniref:RRM domain-containing protein n=1 Tax=Cylindrotheca closterium TaxID=2856 RepID=A0AAD2FTE2_9STRA|nr:unnamed protein product [Cylindrotheca closterium]